MSRAVMQQAMEALELGRDYAEGERLENERRYRGHEHLAPDDAYAVGQIDAAIAALRAALAEQAQPVAWTPVSQAMPKSGAKVLACYRNRLGNLRRIRVEWIAAKTREADSEDAEACVEYDEATDTYYTTEGWYECIDNWGDYSSFAVTEGEVTHWMPLPPEPGAAPEAPTPPAPVAPPGWRMVPVEPTQAMVYAGKEQANKNAGGCRLARKAYSAMLAAAPEAPTPPAPQPLTDGQIERIGKDSVSPWITVKPGTQLSQFARAVEAAVLERMGVQP